MWTVIRDFTMLLEDGFDSMKAVRNMFLDKACFLAEEDAMKKRIEDRPESVPKLFEGSLEGSWFGIIVVVTIVLLIIFQCLFQSITVERPKRSVIVVVVSLVLLSRFLF